MLELHSVAGCATFAFCVIPLVLLFIRRKVLLRLQPRNVLPDHPVLSGFNELTSAFGTQWPPIAADHTCWIPDLQAYHLIWISCQPELTTAVSSTDDADNWRRITQFRQCMSIQLSTRLSAEKIQAALLKDMAPEAWNSFAACVAFLRHAFRWGIAPVVAAAQENVEFDMPMELEIPWKVLQKRYGYAAASGNLTTNVYFNVDYTRSRLRYEINGNMSQIHQRTEWWNSLLFYEIERKALPLYNLMVLSIQSLKRGDLARCHTHLASGLIIMKTTFKYFFDNLTDSNLNRALWMAYVQGFHGWAAGIPLQDGVSGGQSFFIRVMDSFLGIRPFPSNEDLHFPLAQRNFLNSMREYDIRSVASQNSDPQIQSTLHAMVNQLRIWRMGHMKRMEVYEGVPRPERKKMTAGKSVVEDNIAPCETAMVNHLRAQLRQRLDETQ